MNKRILTIVISLMLAATGGCSPSKSGVAAPTDTVASTASNWTAAISTADEPNFLLLISDEPNDIGDFEELWVSITGVGLILGDEEGIVEEVFETPVLVNLVELTGDAAIALWEGYVPESNYTRVFLYVDEVFGLLNASQETIEIKLPSSKLHLDLSVAVGVGEATDFVFDITVLRAGNSGQYILRPQVSQSGQGAEYRLMEQTSERVRVDRPEWAGKPEWAAQGDNGEAGNPDSAGKPEWAPDRADGNAGPDNGEPARPEGAGQPDSAGKPSWHATTGGGTG